MEVMQDSQVGYEGEGQTRAGGDSGIRKDIHRLCHNAVSLENVLTTLRQYRPKRLICLFGCGGNRSAGRRKGMGFVSGRLADMTVITSDNRGLNLRSDNDGY